MNYKLLAIRAILMGRKYLKENAITNDEYAEFLEDDTIDREELKLIRSHREKAIQEAIDA